MSNTVLEQIQQVLGNLVRNFDISQTYVDKNYPWTVILSAAAFPIRSTNSRLKGCSPLQLVFGHDMILPIKYEVDWELMHQRKQAQINNDDNRENRNRVDYGYKVIDEVVLANHTIYK